MGKLSSKRVTPLFPESSIRKVILQDLNYNLGFKKYFRVETLYATQCDQMVILLFNIWPVTTMTICPVA